MPQFGALLADDSRVIIYNRNAFIVQAIAFKPEGKGWSVALKLIYNMSSKSALLKFYLCGIRLRLSLIKFTICNLVDKLVCFSQADTSVCKYQR